MHFPCKTVRDVVAALGVAYFNAPLFSDSNPQYTYRMDNVESLIIEQFKALRSDIAGMRSEMHAEFRDVKARLSHVEQSVAGIRRDSALSADDYARQQVSIDTLVERIQRIEKRLELTS